MEMLRRQRFELDGIHSGSWYHCNKDILLLRRGRLYSSCVQISMLHGTGSETWPIRKENEVALHWAEMRMVNHGIDRDGVWHVTLRQKLEFQVKS